MTDLQTDLNQAPRAPIPRALVLALLANIVWVNASEIFRYFVFVMPMMRDTFAMVPGIAPMNLPVFLVWGIWDTILIIAITGFSWLWLERFGSSARQAVWAGTLVWAAVFVMLWLGLYNMRLATPAILVVALPLAWLEMVVAAMIVLVMRRSGRSAVRI
jgi:hypothetical protein